jgi:hypothetical protein
MSERGSQHDPPTNAFAPGNEASKGGSGPKGNRNAARAKIFRHALIAVLDKYEDADKKIVAGKALEAVATTLVKAAIAGEPWAVQELANRTDGKPPQAIVGEDEDGNQVPFKGVIELVKP